jgi:hypothetical protein
VSNKYYIKQSAEETARSRAYAGQLQREVAARRREAREAQEASAQKRRADHAEQIVDELMVEMGLSRPKTRGDCAEGPRPCPWVGCRMHIQNPIGIRMGREININRGNGPLSPDDWTEATPTCALDLIDARYGDEMTLDEIGVVMGGVSRERIRQIEDEALKHVRSSPSQMREVKEMLEPMHDLRGPGLSGSNKRAATVSDGGRS